MTFSKFESGGEAEHSYLFCLMLVLLASGSVFESCKKLDKVVKTWKSNMRITAEVYVNCQDHALFCIWQGSNNGSTKYVISLYMMITLCGKIKILFITLWWITLKKSFVRSKSKYTLKWWQFWRGKGEEKCSRQNFSWWNI